METWGAQHAAGGRLPPSLRVLRYHLFSYLRTWRSSLTTSFLAPVLYLAAMGVGLGSLINHHVGTVDHVRYLSFVAPGLLAASAMQVAASDSMYPVMAAIKWIRTYYAMLATPLAVKDVVLGHFGWVTVRLVITSVAYLGIMAAFGTVHSALAPLALVAAILVGLSFAGVISAFAATQETTKVSRPSPVSDSSRCSCCRRPSSRFASCPGGCTPSPTPPRCSMGSTCAGCWCSVSWTGSQRDGTWRTWLGCAPSGWSCPDASSPGGWSCDRASRCPRLPGRRRSLPGRGPGGVASVPAQRGRLPPRVAVLGLGLLRALLLPGLDRPGAEQAGGDGPPRWARRRLHRVRRPRPAGRVRNERRDLRLHVQDLLSAQDHEGLRLDAVHAAVPGRRRRRGAAVGPRPRRPVLRGLHLRDGRLRLRGHALGRAVPPGLVVRRLRLRRGRDGRHLLHAQLAGLRLRVPGCPPAVLVLGHLLPAWCLPRVAAAGGPVHPAVPGGRLVARSGSRAVRLVPARACRVPLGDGRGRPGRDRPAHRPPGASLSPARWRARGRARKSCGAVLRTRRRDGARARGQGGAGDRWLQRTGPGAVPPAGGRGRIGGVLRHRPRAGRDRPGCARVRRR